MSRATFLVTCAVLALACQRDNPVEPITTPSDGNRPPVVGRIWGTIQTMEGGIADFSPESASDPDGDSLSYAWDFGDGAREVGPRVRVQHLYIDDGVFPVTLVVSDPRGAADTANATVTINNYPPYISGASLTAPTMPAKVPAQVAVAVAFSDEGILDHPVMVVDWGDGLVSSDTTHSYTIPGVYAVTVIVTDKDGAATRQILTELIWLYDPSNSAVPVPGYEVVDLGTLGGEFTRPSGLNNRGEVVGTSATGDGKTHAFLWRDGVLTDISPSGQDIAEARRINDAGWVAGVGGVGFSGQVPRWKDGVFTDFLPVPASEYGAWPAKILASGDVILNIEEHEYPRPVFVRSGTVIDLGTLSNSTSRHGWAADINTREQIVGSSAYQSSGAARLDFRAFLWEDGVMQALTNLGTGPCPDVPERQCGYSAAADINETGQIVGASFNGTQVRAVLWNASERTPHDVGFGTGASQAVAINERGQIVGESWNADGSGTDKGFFRDTDGSVTDLGSLGGGATHVVGMNEAGMVAGTSKTVGGEIHPFIWRPETGMVDLGVGPFGGRGVGGFATAINDRGDVVGYAVPCRDALAGGCSTYDVPARAFLWRAKAPATARR